MNLKERFTLYRLLRKNEKTKAERHPMLAKNKFMKFLMVFMYLYYAAILLLLGVTMPLGLRDKYCDVAAFHVLDGLFPYLLVLDFWVRFLLQETPAQQAKPYALLPIRRSFLMHTYLIRSLFSFGNLFWFFFLSPFGAIAIWPLMGFGPCLMWWIAWWIMFVANSLAYQFARALCIRTMRWILVPALLHGGLLYIMIAPKHNPLDMPCTRFLYACTQGQCWPFLIIIAIGAFFYWANYKLQKGMVHDEVGKKEEVTMKHATEMNYFNRFGAMGEYLKMEMKLRLRNKQVKMSFFTLLGCILFLSGMLYFSDAYDNGFMKSFICLYDYIVLGGTTLATIMCYEGNYIDGLMSRRESIFDLLKAKYYFNSALLLIPFILLIPLMAIGKISPLMNLGYLFFTIGVLYPGLFQMAAYNKESIPLNQKMTGKQGNSMTQIIAMLMIFLPVAVERIGVVTVGENITYLVMISTGIIGIALHPKWLRNIYRRFMARRYTNMEGFRASRN